MKSSPGDLTIFAYPRVSFPRRCPSLPRTPSACGVLRAGFPMSDEGDEGDRTGEGGQDNVGGEVRVLHPAGGYRHCPF